MSSLAGGAERAIGCITRSIWLSVSRRHRWMISASDMQRNRLMRQPSHDNACAGERRLSRSDVGVVAMPELKIQQ